MPYSIMMDAGHGGRDPGAVYNGRQEKDDALRLALAVGGILQERGIDVEYTRTTDVYETPFQKATEANEAGADLFISIHRNSFPTVNGAFGVESLVYDLSGLKYEIAQSVNQQLETVGFRNLGVKARPNLVVLKRTKMPAVLIEVGFLNSDTDNQLFDENFPEIALAIAEGILDVLQKNGLVEKPGSDPASAPKDRDAESGMEGIRAESEGAESGAEEAGARADETKKSGTGGAAESGSTGVADSKRTEGTDTRRGPAPEYHIQVGSFKNRNYAERLENELLEQDYPAYIEERDGYIRVRVGEYDSLNEAAAEERRLKREGYQTLLVREQSPG